jgi:hypothetical protein
MNGWVGALRRGAPYARLRRAWHILRLGRGGGHQSITVTELYYWPWGLFMRGPTRLVGCRCGRIFYARTEEEEEGPDHA